MILKNQKNLKIIPLIILVIFLTLYSILDIKNISIHNSKIGIATKDGSNTIVNNCKIYNSSYVAAIIFIKKDFYSSPKMQINNCQTNTNNPYLSQKGTSLFIDGIKKQEISFNTKTLYN